MYRVWREKKKKINKSVDERNILGWCAAQSSPPSSSEPIFHSTAYRMRARLRNRLISFSSSVAFLHSPPPNCALMRIFPLGFSPKPILRESSDEKFSGGKKKKKKTFSRNDSYKFRKCTLARDQCAFSAFIGRLLGWCADDRIRFQGERRGGCKLTITSEQCCGTMLQHARVSRNSFDQKKKIISSFFIGEGGNEIVG